MNGDQALALVTIGTLLAFVEFNRPGKVFPGACGTFLLLLGSHRLSVLIAWTSGVLCLGLAGAASLVLLRWRLLLGAPAVLGTGLFVTAFALLARESGGSLQMASACGCGLLLGCVSSWLMAVAGRAWRAKTGHGGAGAKRGQTGVAEWRGVD